MTIAIRPDVRDLSGQLGAAEIEQVRRWVGLNRDTLVRFWDGDIEYTEDVLPLLRRVGS
jgi:hypothetical protein